MPLDEFSALVEVPAADISAWAELGLLDPAGRGQFDELDLLRLMAIRHYGALGYTPESFAEALASGDIEIRLGEYLYPRGRELSLDEAAEELGIEPDVLRSLRTALGFSRETYLEHDLELLRGFQVMSDAGMPFEAVLEGARVFGDSLRRLAETETRLVHVHLHERLEEEGEDEPQIIRQIEDLQAAVLPLLDSIVERVHHEHLLLASIEDAYVHLVDTDAPGGRGSVDATIAFIDVESFTQLTEAEGDAAALEAITRVDSAVRGLALPHGGKVVKQIGDALMLAFRDSADAVRFAAELEQTVRGEPSLPRLRIGMHCGPAIYRGGDYLGTTVNVASRVASQAAAGETLMTETVVDRVDDGPAVEPAGVRILRGMERPLPLYRLRREDEKQDPVCGKRVKSPPAARLSQDGEELWFCSRDCLRQYLGSEAAVG
ncbi:MAG TPA: adenylate/guanylate cyclase domain-containing protein [Solirubrobacteraceae bacterium]|nr:adenylate/guanylate cyclase domain-containing protein [Solirubrobacteraceae bacterium]